MNLNDIDIMQSLIMKSVSEISYIIRSSDPIECSKITNKSNKCGDDVKKLDVRANEVIKNNFLDCGLIKYIGSEEEPELIKINENGRYLISFDPLDGSSNISCNITTGSIFCVFEYINGNILNGKNIVLAAYSLFGGCTQLVCCHSKKINIYNLDPINDKFKLTESNFTLKDQGNIYSINESNKHKYNYKLNNFTDFLINNKYTSRWVGSLVADFHRTIIKAGFLSYPANSDNSSGKIRLLYEAYPLAYIIENLGGSSSNGIKSLLELDFPWENIHKKTPIFFGSRYEMFKLIDFLK